MLLRMKNVSKIYQRRGEDFAAVHQVNFIVDSGEFIGIVGKSGSGKSTLLNLIAGLLTPTSGEIELGNQIYSELTEGESALLRNKKIGFIPQGKSLLNNFTVLDNLRLPLYLNQGEHDLASEFTFVEDLLEKVGLQDLANEYPANLSGGEQRRVAIARSLVSHPDLILADEPTSDLDDDTKQDVLTLLHRIHRTGKTIIMVTHQKDSLTQVNRVYRMDAGELSFAQEFAK